MPRIPVVSGGEMIRVLERAGFMVIGQEGSHIKMRRHTPERTYTAIVPVHPELARRTLLSILRQAGLTREDFLSLLT